MLVAAPALVPGHLTLSAPVVLAEATDQPRRVVLCRDHSTLPQVTACHSNGLPALDNGLQQERSSSSCFWSRVFTGLQAALFVTPPVARLLQELKPRSPGKTAKGLAASDKRQCCGMCPAMRIRTLQHLPKARFMPELPSRGHWCTRATVTVLR